MDNENSQLLRRAMIKSSLIEPLVLDVILLITQYDKRCLVNIATLTNNNFYDNPYRLLEYDVDFDVWTVVVPIYAMRDEDHIVTGHYWRLHEHHQYQRFDRREKKWTAYSPRETYLPDCHQVINITPSSILYRGSDRSIQEYIFQTQTSQELSRSCPCYPANECYLYYFRQHPQYLYMMEDGWPLHIYQYDLDDRSKGWELISSFTSPDWKIIFDSDHPRFFNASENVIYYGWLQNHKDKEQYGMLAFHVQHSTWSIMKAPLNKKGSWAVFLPNDVDVLVYYEISDELVHFNMFNGKSRKIDMPYALNRNSVRVDMCYT